MKEILPDSYDNRVIKVPADALGRELGNALLRLPGPLLTQPAIGHTDGGIVLILIDCSGTMKQNNKLESVRDGTLNFARDAMNKGMAVGIIQFDTHVTEICKPTRELGNIRESLLKLDAGGITNMAEAINLGHRRLQGYSGNKVMFIVTDGVPNGDDKDPKTTLAAAADAKRDGIIILALGTDDAPEAFLKELQS